MLRSLPSRNTMPRSLKITGGKLAEKQGDNLLETPNTFFKFSPHQNTPFHLFLFEDAWNDDRRLTTLSMVKPCSSSSFH